MAGEKKVHRERKNGSAHEAWQKRKFAANSARPKQIASEVTATGVTKVIGPFRPRA